MADDIAKILKQRIGEDGFNKLMKIDNPALHQTIAKYIELCNPDRVFVCTGKPDEIQYIREAAIRNGEEQRLATEWHTVHFDNYYDQGRDKKNTGILVPKGVELDAAIETKDRDTALKEIHEILKDIMKGKEMYVCFFCLGSTNSEFSIPAVQITDSSYVTHSETILYRPGYEEFVIQGPRARIFKFVHS